MYGFETLSKMPGSTICEEYSQSSQCKLVKEFVSDSDTSDDDGNIDGYSSDDDAAEGS